MSQEMKIVFPNIQKGALGKEQIAERIMRIVALHEPFLFASLGNYYVE